MPRAQKPKTKDGYTPEATELVRRTTLSVATKLGDFLLDDVVIIGGLVPTLLVEIEHLPDGVEPHVGTTDLDLGLTLAVRDESRYSELRDRLVDADFKPAKNEDGHELRQTWVAPDGAKVDFFIPFGSSTPGPGKLQTLRGNFAASVTPGLDLAFEQRVLVTLDGKTIDGASAKREVPVCGPGAFAVLKALAHEIRGERKDAYDLNFIAQYYGAGPEDVGSSVAELLADENAVRAVEYLGENFTQIDQTGPRDVAQFLTGDLDDEIQADVVGAILTLLRACGS